MSRKEFFPSSITSKNVKSKTPQKSNKAQILRPGSCSKSLSQGGLLRFSHLVKKFRWNLLMSGGTPTANGGLMRQRFNQVYSSNGEDLEDDDACSSPSMDLSLPMIQKAKNWHEVLENLAWVVSVVVIVYFGDWEANLVSVLWSDARIRRTSLHLGSATAVLNLGLVIYKAYSISSLPKSFEKSDALSSAAPFLVALGFLSFCLLSYALWPIWSVLTIPLLFTLFMASIVVSPYLLIGPLRPQSAVLRAD